MKIVIETIPHNKQRYPTVGDWFYDDDDVLHIRVSKLSDDRRQFLIALHELVEAGLCRYEGVHQAEVDGFDKAFENVRPDGDNSEPGDDPRAPYASQHCFATGIERLIASRLGICWSHYENELNAM